MVSNSAKLDRRTKQHTEFGVSASNGSRDIARTKVAEKKEKKKRKKNERRQNYIASPTGIAKLSGQGDNTCTHTDSFDVEVSLCNTHRGAGSRTFQQ